MHSFEARGTAFVSVTQQFHTGSSMGRLVLNVLLSFTQFEREPIAERTRDKVAAARRKGHWTGGRPVLGYAIECSPARATAAATPRWPCCCAGPTASRRLGYWRGCARHSA